MSQFDFRVDEGEFAACMADISADVLGRMFDVFLRGNFESKGGLGVYLTPAPVKRAMLKIAFHDIMTETPQILTARDEDGKPAFRFCDPACGSYGFGVVAMGQLERALMELLGKETAEDARRNPFFIEMKEHSFVGADSAPLMVTLARVNMALLGAPKAKIFYTEDSLVSPQLEPCQYDLNLHQSTLWHAEVCQEPGDGQGSLREKQRGDFREIPL